MPGCTYMTSIKWINCEDGYDRYYHCNDEIMSAMASQITGCSGANQWKCYSSASLALMRRIHRSPVDSPHKGPVTRWMFLFDDVIMMLLRFNSAKRPHYSHNTHHVAQPNLWQGMDCLWWVNSLIDIPHIIAQFAILCHVNGTVL